MSTNVTQITVSAMRKVFALLEDNFDPVKGEYLHGFSDKRIATETGISVDGVKKYRTDGFGKLQPPTELTKIRQELGELENLFLKMEGEMKASIKDLKQRAMQMQRNFD